MLRSEKIAGFALQHLMQQLSFLETPAVVDYPIGKKTSMGIGGNCDLFIQVANPSELQQTLRILQKQEVETFIYGRGTNLLVQDTGFAGAVIQLSGSFKEAELSPTHCITAGAGISDARVAKFAREHNLSGMEFLATVPGSLGGAIYMNAGAHGQEISQIIKWVEILTPKGDVQKLNKEELNLNYRSSRFKQSQGEAILRAEFQLHPKDGGDIRNTELEWLKHRKQSQPVSKKTCGSVFKNPEGDSAGRLIDSCGLKGTEVGGVRISPLHANFIENQNSGSFGDLIKCIEMIQDRVYQKHHVRLTLEGQIFPPYK